jgi:hypothetical protein
MLNISTLNTVGDGELREYLLRCPSTLVYSEPRFIKLVSDHLGACCYWLVARRGDVITGLMPFLVKDGPLGPAFNSLGYYGSNGGVIQVENDIASKAALVDCFYDTAADAKAVSATIITNPLANDSDFYNSNVRHDFRDERIGQVTHLPIHPEELLTIFDAPRPRNIRRALKEGITVERGGRERLDFLYRTHLDNMKAIGGIPKASDFFKAIPLSMKKDDWAVFTALHNGKPIASLLVFYFNRTVEYFTPVVIESCRNMQALTLVIYEAMQDAIRNGFTNWNWGGTWINQRGVYDFKKRWGTSEYRYFYYTRVSNSDLMDHDATFFLKNYPGFFIIPFNALKKQT